MGTGAARGPIYTGAALAARDKSTHSPMDHLDNAARACGGGAPRIKESAGIVIRWGPKILMCHSTDKAASGFHTPPKGGVEPGESHLDAAIRETLEEVGILVSPGRLSAGTTEIRYMGDRQRTLKICRLFTYTIQSPRELGLESEVVPRSMLRAGEIDWAGFLDRGQAQGLVNPHYMVLYDGPAGGPAGGYIVA